MAYIGGHGNHIRNQNTIPWHEAVEAHDNCICQYFIQSDILHRREWFLERGGGASYSFQVATVTPFPMIYQVSPLVQR